MSRPKPNAKFVGGDYANAGPAAISNNLDVLGRKPHREQEYVTATPTLSGAIGEIEDLIELTDEAVSDLSGRLDPIRTPAPVEVGERIGCAVPQLAPVIAHLARLADRQREILAKIKAIDTTLVV